MHSLGKKVNELHAMLKTHEEMLPKKGVPPALNAIRAGKVQKHNNKPSKAAKRVQGKGKGKMPYAKAAPSYAPKPKNPPPPKKDNYTKDATCHQCGEVVHLGFMTLVVVFSSVIILKVSGECRLGHISKKRIEKLQHDGLLNSIDVESLGKCVSCMSRKMARKPYSH
ncbi:zinc finger, CCHC-type containing protein [Tanacetum coccineum]